ncbi:hypothetical protein NLI96_g1373 [Meripilus lineatus]|uniref:Uncharacterized protein n=1 Tax=Meripilus lineatus TaxID=2056292 RepID=A0AAD5VG50_9APHY|nr:hypothetical protein NLI96_g1373 [Physisporinus lineatus]
MPKSSKKKKDKAADFSKAKLKLGKGKQTPSNAVDTSFKARSIALPNQRLAREDTSETPTTKRKLSFDDLLGHLKHYNSSTRKDTGPVQATSTASVVLSPKSKLVVLNSLSRFLRRALRVDDHLPDSSSSLGHTPTPTWFFASSFSSNRAFTAFDSLIKPNYEAGSYTQVSSVRQWHPDVDFDNFEEDHIGRYDLGGHDIGNWTFQDLCELNALQAGPSSLSARPIVGYSGQSSLQHLTSTVHQILISTFLDCAPVVFSPSGNPPETELNLVVAVSEIARCLYGNLSRTNSRPNGKNKDASQDLSTFLGYMSPYFPFTPHVSLTGKRDIKTEQAFQDLNVIFCELTSLQLLSSTNENRPTKSKSRPTRTPTTNRKVTSDPRSTIPSPSQAERVGQYVIQLLQGGSGSGPGSHASLPRPLSSSAYNAILPTIWAILSNDGMSEGVSVDALLTTLVDHAIRTSSASPVKKSTIDVLGRLVLVRPQYRFPGLGC